MASLSTEISVWLVKKGAFTAKDLRKKGASCILSKVAGNALVSGLAFACVVDVSGMKTTTSQSSRIHNWALLKPALLSVGLRFDADQIRNIISGDTKTATRLMTSLYAKVQQRNSSGMSNRVKARRGASAFTSKPKLNEKKNSLDESAAEILFEQITDEDMRPLLGEEKPVPGEARTVAGFWIILLCNTLNIRPEQASQLLTSRSAYLSHIMRQGIRGSYVPVIRLVETACQNLDILLTLLAHTKSSLASNLQRHRATNRKRSSVHRWVFFALEWYLITLT